MQSTKRNSKNGKENETKKYMQHDLKLCGKNGKIYEAGVALTEDPEATTTIRPNENPQQCKHCGRNDHQRKSNALCPFFQGKVHCSSTGTEMLADTVRASTKKYDTCVSSGASVGLQDLANWANRTEVAK